MKYLKTFELFYGSKITGAILKDMNNTNDLHNLKMVPIIGGKSLIRNNDINKQDINGNTPLMFSVQRGNFKECL